MTKRRKLLTIGLCMLLIAVIFVLCALSNPTLGSTIRIGDFMIGAEIWRMGYLAYLLVMIGMFLAAFFQKR